MGRKDERIKTEMANDIRKTVKNSKKKGKLNNKNWIKKVFIILLIMILIVGIVILIKNRKLNIKIEAVKQYNYFLFSENNKTGVIDRNGNVVIDAEYDYVQIPNPEKAIFVCMYDYNSSTQSYNTKILNEKKEELYTQYKNISAIPSNNTSNQTTYQTSILKYKENDKYGIITISGKKVVNAIYDSIDTLDYKDEILKVSQNGKYGLIKLNGEKVVKLEYNEITADGYYDENTKYENAGYIVDIKTDDGYRYGYLDKNGKEILNCKYSSIKRITEIKNDTSAYLITYENGQAGLNKNGQTVIKNEYTSLEYDDTSKLVSLEKVGKFGVYDLYGNMILPIQYEDVTFAGKIITTHKDGKFLVFDANGNIQKDCNFSSIMPTKSNDYFITMDANKKYGIIDSNETVLVENKYSYIEYAFDKYFIASKDEKTGLIDNTGKEILANKYNVVQNVNGTNIIQAINSNTNVSEIYDKNIEKVAEITNAHIYIENGHIKIMSDTDALYLDLNGNRKEAKEILSDNKIFAKQQNGKWGYVDENGNTVVDFQYDMATDINEYGFGAIKKDGKWGSVNSKGTIVKAPSYKLNNIAPTFIGEFYRESADYEMDSYSRTQE